MKQEDIKAKHYFIMKAIEEGLAEVREEQGNEVSEVLSKLDEKDLTILKHWESALVAKSVHKVLEKVV